MSLPAAFWDSSAIIPLCVLQPQTAQAKVHFKSYGIVVWWATPVEIRSGLTRLLRMAQIGQDQFLIGKRLADDVANVWEMIHPSATVADRACTLLEQYPLRSTDSLQLAAALEYFGQIRRGTAFVTADQRLAAAAARAGFTVECL